MKRIKVNELKGGEYLSAPVILENGNKLFYEGTCVHLVHIDRLIENKIEEVEIFEDDFTEKKSKEVIRQEVQEDCKNKLKEVVNVYICKENKSLKEVTETANEIIEDILLRDDLTQKVYDIKVRNGNIYDHSVRVAVLSIITAVKMNLEKNMIFSIGVGSLLHDIGLKYVSVDYMDVDPAMSDPENYFEFKKHTIYGLSAVEKESWMSSSAKKIILFHHEKINGTGYPLKQKMIPEEVKIVSICDAFDDKICGIGCIKGNVPEAIDNLKKYKDIFYDGKVVDVFLEFVAQYPVGTKVETNLGDTAIVIEQNDQYTDRPSIQLICDKDGNKYSDGVVINLAEKRSILIEKVIE